MSITYRSTAPAAADYHALFETTGWNEEYRATPEELDRANRASWVTVAAWDGERLVGFGRVVTDGVLHAMVYDLIVHPDRQRQGIGSRILEQLVARSRAAGIRDIQLFCAAGKQAFYDRHGFVARPADAPGMQLRAEI